MAKVIELKDKTEIPPSNLITSKPWEFRRADWESNHFIQMLKSQSLKLEMHRKEVYEKGDRRIWHLPAHYPLNGGMACTIQGMYLYREHEAKMRELYYLAGLIDCMINQVNPLLRTDLIRDIYKTIVRLKKELQINWYGHMDQVLFPVEKPFYSILQYREALSKAKTMKELYRSIREGIEEMFDILALEYVFYSPGRGA